MKAPSVELINPSDERWASALDRVPHDVYVTPAYVGAEALRLGAEPMGCLIDDGSRIFLLPLLIRPVCDAVEPTKDAISPYGYPGIVVNGDSVATDDFSDECLRACLEALRENNVCSAFVRLHPLLNETLGEQVRRHPIAEHGLTVSIDLAQSAEQAWADLSKGHANAINRASRAFRVEIHSASERFDEFTMVYTETLQRLGAAETYHFSDEYLRRLAAMEEAFVAVAYTADDVIAGAYMFFESHGTVQMHLGGPRTEFRKPSPSHLMIHTVAQWARDRGNSTVHLGGGVGAAVDDSLFTFKAGFSPCRHPYRTLLLVADERKYCALTKEHARQTGSSAEDLLSSGFFPAYRATPNSGV